jgi:hypothetical protein
MILGTDMCSLDLEEEMGEISLRIWSLSREGAVGGMICVHPVRRVCVEDLGIVESREYYSDRPTIYLQWQCADIAICRHGAGVTLS